MSLDIGVLLQTLSDSTQAQEPRESPAFAEMEREIDKLSSLSSDRQPNWTRIEQLACEYLSQQSKDYLVASWLSEAWTQRHAMLGVNAGLGLFAGLSEKFWQQSIPPTTRLRGRRNAMLWWIDRLCDWLEKQSEIAIGADLAETMIVNAKSLDAALAEKDPEAPSLVKLLSLLKRIPVEQHQTASADESASSSPDLQPSLNPSTAPSAAPPVSQSTIPSKSASVSNLKAPSFSGKNEINSLEDVVKLLQPAQDYISQICPVLFDFNNTHPLGIYLTRFAARASIFEIPPASSGQTAIPPPPSSTVDSFEKVVGLKNPLGLVEFCESRISTFPFWFDLDFQSARGFGMMGSVGVRTREAIIDMVLSFVNKIPNVEQFAFSDGMPFASLETLTWIKQCKEERSGHVHQDAFSEIRSQAQAQISEGQFEQGLHILHEYIHGNRSGREQFRARLILVQTVLSQDPQADVMSFVEPLIEDCLSIKLDQWEPELASQAWELKVRAARQVMLSTRSDIDADRRSKAFREYEIALKHLSNVDFVSASRLAT